MADMEKRIEAANEALRRLEVSKNEVARRAGISSSTASTVLAGTYTGDIEGSLQKIEAVIETLQNKERAFFSAPDFVQTSVYTKIDRMLKDAMTVTIPRFTVLYGPSGSGKTHSLRRFVADNPSSVLLPVRSDYSTNAVLVRLSQELGLSQAGANHHITDRIIDKLKGSGRLVIFDEAEYLKPATLDLIRSIRDTADVPMALVGMPKLYFIISSLRGNFEQIANRMISFNLVSRDRREYIKDIRAVIEAALNGKASDLVDAFTAEAPQSIRESVLLMQDVINYGGRSGKPITREMIRGYKSTQH